MKENPQFGERINSVRTAKNLSQVEFADLLGVSQATVSAWESEDHPPSPEAYVRLGNLAPFPDNMWFWQQAGLDKQGMLSAAERTLKERTKERSALADQDLLREIKRFRLTAQGPEEVGPPLLIAADRVPNPLSTVCYLLDEKTAGLVFAPGDVVAVDSSGGSPIDFKAFSDQVDLVRFGPRADQQKPEWLDWPEGPRWGRLRCKRWSTSDNTWVATLGPVDDLKTKFALGDGSILIGMWTDVDSPSQFGEGLVPEEKRREAEGKIHLYGGCQILGRVVAWFPALTEKK
jgi:transcriptional regulator with XRE-family HTH domain